MLTQAEIQKTGTTTLQLELRLMSTEKETLRHVTAQLRYQRSPRYARDLAADKQRRAKANAKAGHTPQCSLTKCAPGCRSAYRAVVIPATV